MKRGKDEEKILEPMFPRLHVNDADKGGGPRAPPRNKMALYEQLTIPSHRFNDRTSASFPRNTSTTLVPPAPSNQACGLERNLSGQQRLESLSTGRATDDFVSQQRDQRKIVREEDDFAVPVFVNSRRSNKSGKHTAKRTDLEKSATSSGRGDGCETTTRVVGVNNGVESHMASEEEGHGEYCAGGGYTSLQQINEEEASDDVSDDSMVDSVSSVDVSPDDVVGVLGQKRFWRARKAIANQQRVFAVQLFELHRLIKVQRLIAASPDVLLDDISYIGKVAAPVKKLLPSGFIVKPPLPQAIKRRSSDSEKTDQNKMECSAENVVGRLSNQGDHHHHQPSNYMPFATNHQPTANGGYYPPPPQPQPLPSGGNQQWLIPVMSPSEGLIYKPHPGPGHTGPVCGGYYGHFMPAPMVMGNFMGGGGQPPPFHPGMGFPSHGNNGYFPPYGIMMNPYYSGQQQQQPPSEQMNNSIQQQQQQSSVNEAASQQQQQQQPTKSYPRARKSRQGSTGSSPEGIISGKKNSFRPFSAADKINNAPPEDMMTTTTTTTTTVTQTTRDGAGVTRVIKVVPHNANLASENAARIFRSIQEERKQYDDAFADYP